MTLTTALLAYGAASERQIIKKYSRGNENQGHDKPTLVHTPRKVGIIAIHGGAWRDPNNTCNDFDKFAEIWLGKNNGDVVCVYSLDYKLSSEEGGMFPYIMDDIFKSMKIIKDDSAGDVDEFIICGHSVGCTFITQLLESNGGDDSKLNITKAVFLDGIYDIKNMLEEYPSYEFFVVEEFGDVSKAVKECNAITRGDGVPDVYKELREITVVHSLEDELLSVQQPTAFVEWLRHSGVCVETQYGHYGLHNDVYVNPAVAKLCTK